MVTSYHIVGASGRSGAALCRSLLADGLAFTPVVRSAARWAATGLAGEPMLADLCDGPAMARALAGATHVVSCAHARHVPAILAASAGASFVFLGSTRKFTRWPDEHGNAVLAGEAAFLASGRRGVMLHPTMIYGAQGEDNVQRLATLLRRLPIVPLPQGGRSLVQPVHQDDVTASLRAALTADWEGCETIILAGPQAISYAGFVRAVAAAAGLGAPRIVAVPRWAVVSGGLVAGAIPGLPRIGGDEIRRLTEDKAFDITPMRRRLGVHPMAFEQGLSRVFAQGAAPVSMSTCTVSSPLGKAPSVPPWNE